MEYGVIRRVLASVKSRLQMQGEGGKLEKRYSGTFSALRSIAEKEGIAGLYRGLLPAVLFQMVGNSCRCAIKGCVAASAI
jgi:hypothetical protein